MNNKGMRKEHNEVLSTLYKNGLISYHKMKSVKGQLFIMTHDQREAYLKKIIAKSSKERKA